MRDHANRLKVRMALGCKSDILLPRKSFINKKDEDASFEEFTMLNSSFHAESSDKLPIRIALRPVEERFS